MSEEWRDLGHPDEDVELDLSKAAPSVESFSLSEALRRIGEDFAASLPPMPPPPTIDMAGIREAMERLADTVPGRAGGYKEDDWVLIGRGGEGPEGSIIAGLAGDLFVKRSPDEFPMPDGLRRLLGIDVITDPDGPVELVAVKRSMFLPLPHELLVDLGLETSSAPPVKVSRWSRFRSRLREKISMFRLRLGIIIAGVDLRDEEDW